MKKSIILLFFLCIQSVFSQEMSGEDLLNKAIQFHDPNNQWSTFSGSFVVTMKTPNTADRVSLIAIDLPNEVFSLSATRGANTTMYKISPKGIDVEFNGEKPSDEVMQKNGLSEARAQLFKNYYTYLYGLPMKLKDNGTIIHEKVERKNFKGKEYLVMKVTYSKEVGKDTWYFYFDPKTYAMEIYQFYKDGPQTGEYILLSGIETIRGIKMPKQRAWYYNKDDKYLGTDILAKQD